ncbi:MAG: hypothetical protein EU530_05565 [Promethearchaeota archaeon]|nr:MAG: hypothetical protein EU530_05565 [Candidatus Lokiarchaeota archaeon]
MKFFLQLPPRNRGMDDFIGNMSTIQRLNNLLFRGMFGLCSNKDDQIIYPPNQACTFSILILREAYFVGLKEKILNYMDKTIIYHTAIGTNYVK